jgi:hypothetical protein
MVAGLHVPVILLVDIGCNAGAVVPAQNGGIASKDGVIELVIVTEVVVLKLPHPPPPFTE